MVDMGKAPRSLLLAGAALAALAIARMALANDLIPGASPDARTAGAAPVVGGQPDWRGASGQMLTTAGFDQAIEPVIAEWRRLSQNDSLGFEAYARFLLANPGWPGSAQMRSVAERSINPDSYAPSEVIAFFDAYPPRSATGYARQAAAFASLQRMNEARMAARSAWTSGTLSPADEARLLALFAPSLTSADHLAHADQALWGRNPAAAERVLAYLPATRRPLIEARIAMQRRAPEAALSIAAADPIGVTDGGYLLDKASWLYASNDWTGSRRLLAERAPLAQPVADPARWYDFLLAQARAAAKDNQWTVAWGIASRVDDAYPAGTDISDKPLAVRDDYTSLTWLAGTAALNKLGRPSDAIGMFSRYANGARTGQTISKGLYWAGRAALAAGRRGEADDWFRKASAYSDQFYGQLALERLGLPVPRPGTATRSVELSAADRAAFRQRSVVRAARQLGATGNWQDQTRMLRAIAAEASTDKELLLAADFARDISRPDLGVMVGRRAVMSGLAGYGEASFPRIPVPAERRLDWTMIHAIARQESQFDRQIVSHAGARGLMQLMPGTARETAGKIGIDYSMSSLNDPHYNIQLGSSYFQGLLRRYDGYYPLAVAAYNAGPGNVNKWIAANGDPRDSSVDIVQWIEDIPIYETRNYVQRVLENAVVYDLLNPANGNVRIVAPLSRYLGKEQPG